MSNSTVPSNDRAVEYVRCEPWCDYRTDPDGHEYDYCARAVGNRAVMGMAHTGVYAEISTSKATARLPLDAPADTAAFAARHHRDVVQVMIVGIGFADVVVSLQPGDARSLAAFLVRSADIADGLVTR